MKTTDLNSRDSRDGADANAEAALPGRPWELRRRELRRVFERIEPHYDRLNRLLSLGLDRGWREWTARSIEVAGPWLDLASGTGDLAVHLYRRRERARSRPILIRSDLVPTLLGAAARKLRDPGADRGDASPGLGCEMDQLPFATGSIGAIVQGFALRHCRDYSQFFVELHRVLRPGGQVAILDMRYPGGRAQALYRFYFRAVLPRLAVRLGGDPAAYRFLVDSVRSMPAESRLLEALREAGFTRVESRPGFLGSVRLLLAWKPLTLAGSSPAAYSASSATPSAG